MLYPVYVHQQQDSAYGAIVPDLPGVHSAADELAELRGMIQEAAMLMYDCPDNEPPPPSPVTSHSANPQFQSGFWITVHIGFSETSTQPS